MNAEDTANHILVDGNAESQGDLLGDAGTTPVGITPFEFNDCVDEFFMRSFRATRTPALARKQHAVLSFSQHLVEMQQRGWLQDDGGTQNACRVHEKGAQTGDDTLCGAQVGSTTAAAIEDSGGLPAQHLVAHRGAPDQPRRRTATLEPPPRIH